MTEVSDPPADDPSLAILRELEAELARELGSIERRPQAERRGRWRAGEPGHSPGRRHQWRAGESGAAPGGHSRQQSSERGKLLGRGPRRVTRRALTLVALASLVGASALATEHSVFGGPSPSTTGPARLSQGVVDGERWQLQAYTYHGATCYSLFTGDTATSACGSAPSAGSVRAVSALTPARRLVAGVTGAGVAQVLVRVGRRTALAHTHPPGGAGARGADLPRGLRWFVVLVPNAANLDDAAPAQLTPRARDGRRLGPAVLDCTLGASSALCRRAASRIAATS